MAALIAPTGPTSAILCQSRQRSDEEWGSQREKPFLPGVSQIEIATLWGGLGGPGPTLDLEFIVEEEADDAPEIGPSNHHC